MQCKNCDYFCGLFANKIWVCNKCGMTYPFEGFKIPDKLEDIPPAEMVKYPLDHLGKFNWALREEMFESLADQIEEIEKYNDEPES